MRISKGIPQSFMVKAEPGTKGAMLTSTGEYAIPAIDAYVLIATPSRLLYCSGGMTSKLKVCINAGRHTHKERRSVLRLFHKTNLHPKMMQIQFQTSCYVQSAMT